MSLVIVKRTVIATHMNTALTAYVKEYNLIATAHEISVGRNFIELFTHLSLPQPVPLKTIDGALKTRAIGYEQHRGAMSP